MQDLFRVFEAKVGESMAKRSEDRPGVLPELEVERARQAALTAGTAALERGPRHGLVCLEPGHLKALMQATTALLVANAVNEGRVKPIGKAPAKTQDEKTDVRPTPDPATENVVAPAGAGLVELEGLPAGARWRVVEGVELRPVLRQAGSVLEAWVRLPAPWIAKWVRLNNAEIAQALRALVYIGADDWPTGVEVPVPTPPHFTPEPLPEGPDLETLNTRRFLGLEPPNPLVVQVGPPAFTKEAWHLDELTRELDHPNYHGIAPQSAVMPDDDATGGAYPGLPRHDATARQGPSETALRDQWDREAYTAQIAAAQRAARTVHLDLDPTIVAAQITAASRIAEALFDSTTDDDAAVTRAVRAVRQVTRELRDDLVAK